MSIRVVHITTFPKNSLDTLGIIEDRSKKFADFLGGFGPIGPTGPTNSPRSNMTKCSIQSRDTLATQSMAQVLSLCHS